MLVFTSKDFQLVANDICGITEVRIQTLKRKDVMFFSFTRAWLVVYTRACSSGFVVQLAVSYCDQMCFARLIKRSIHFRSLMPPYQSNQFHPSLTWISLLILMRSIQSVTCRTLFARLSGLSYPYHSLPICIYGILCSSFHSRVASALFNLAHTYK